MTEHDEAGMREVFMHCMRLAGVSEDYILAFSQGRADGAVELAALSAMRAYADLRTKAAPEISEERVERARGAMKRVFADNDPFGPMPSFDELARAAITAALKGE